MNNLKSQFMEPEGALLYFWLCVMSATLTKSMQAPVDRLGIAVVFYVILTLYKVILWTALYRLVGWFWPAGCMFDSPAGDALLQRTIWEGFYRKHLQRLLLQMNTWSVIRWINCLLSLSNQSNILLLPLYRHNGSFIHKPKTPSAASQTISLSQQS